MKREREREKKERKKETERATERQREREMIEKLDNESISIHLSLKNNIFTATFQ